MKRGKGIGIAGAVLAGFGALVAWVFVPSSKPELGRAKDLLDPAKIAVRYEYSRPDDDRLVVLIGENRASVRSQVDLEAILGRLNGGGALDAILVEGTNGPLDHADFAKAFGTGLSGRGAAEYWGEQLAWGRVAGYEAFALTHPELPVSGVEDMAAKKRCEVDLTLRDDREVKERNRRAVALFEKAIGDLGGPADREAAAVAELLPAFRSAAEQQGKARETFAEAMRPLSDKEVELAAIQTEALPLYRELEPIIEEARRSRADSRGDDSELRRKYEENRSKFDRLVELNRRVGALRDDAAREGAKLKDPLAGRLEADARAEDQFFLLANAVARAAGGRSFPEIGGFLRVERERMVKEFERDPESVQAQLRERDQAMVDNTVAFLKAQRPGRRTVALVVGSNHLPGVSGFLKAAGISHVGGPLAGNDRALEPWEELAWAWRKRQRERLYSSGQGEGLKELSQLLDPVWKSEQRARVDFLRGLSQSEAALRGYAGDGVFHERLLKTSEAKERHVSVLLTTNPLDRNVDYGAHLADWGPDPNQPGRYYAVYDRDQAGQQVAQFSDANAAFAYFYQTARDGAPAYQFLTPAGVVSKEQFQGSAPRLGGGEKPGCVVLCGEPDLVLEGRLAVSPLWRELRAGGSGGGDRPPPPGKGTAAPGESPRGWSSRWYLLEADLPQDVALYRTESAERAREHVKALDQQKPEALGEVAYLNAGQLDQLPFTPRRGDNAQVVVIVARNVAEFRAELAKAAQEGRVKNKQFALITCGDAFAETTALRELMLHEGALMVWTPDRQVTPEAARHLADKIREVEKASSPGNRPATIDRLIRRALGQWWSENPDDPDLGAFRQSSTWVFTAQVRSDRSDC
jgi:hypothetical protein